MEKHLSEKDLEFLTAKYRRDSSDPATGIANELLPNELLRRVETEWKDLSRPETKAKAFDFLCRNMRIGCSEHDYFPTFGCWNRLGKPMAGLLNKLAAGISEKLHWNDLWNEMNASGKTMLWIDFDHSVPDWDALFELGFPGILRRIRKYHEKFRSTGKITAETEAYFKGLEQTWESADFLLGRFAAQAKIHAGESPRIAAQADSLERLRKGTPENTLDALMMIVMYFFMGEHMDHMQVRSLGNLDVRLEPYLRRDSERGLFGEEQLREMLDCFLMQWGSINSYWAQPFYLGGTAADGSTLYCGASRMILEEFENLDIISPKIQLKIAENTPEWLLDQAFGLVRRSREVVFVCEPGMREGFRRLGYTDEEARTCDIHGCYEYSPSRKTVQTGCGYVNMLKPLERLPEENVPEFHDFFERYWNELRETIENVVRIADEFETHLHEINPAQIFSGTILHSLETGRDAFSNGSVYNNTSLLVCGFASAVDALSAVRTFVYDRRELSLAEWNSILKNDWKGAEAFRTRVLNFPERYGNHREIPDSIAETLAKRIGDLLNGRPNGRGGIWMASSHPAKGFVILGEKTSATPDGRAAGEEMSKNLSPSVGMDRCGVTALLESAVRTGGAAAFPGDACLDLMLHPATVAGEEGLSVLKGLLRYFLRHNGHALQFNIFDPETLRDAQTHPEKYGSLMVRVCGWNTRFNDMNRKEQNAYIERAERIGK